MKRRKCMAEGGVVRETPEQILERMRSKYGLEGTGKSSAPQSGTDQAQKPATTFQPPQPQQRPQPQPQSQNGLMGMATDAIGRRKEELRKAAEYASGGGPLYNDSADRINQQAQVSPGGIASFLSRVPDAVKPITPSLGPNLAQYASPVGASPQSLGFLTGVPDYGTTPAQQVANNKPAFVNSDGSARDMSTGMPSAQPDPIMTMKERDIAAGLDPSRAYRPGTAADPYASGGIGAAGRIAHTPAFDTQQSALPTLDTRSRRQRRQAGYANGGYADGGIIPADIGRGLVEAIAKPLMEDWRQGNKAIKAVRDQYPTLDTIVGIHPVIASAQVANDLISDNVGADTAGNVAQMIPVLKTANRLTKGAVSVPGVGRFAVNMPATVMKNTALTTGQTLGGSANAYASGGIVRFAGAGGPREDKIPVKVAGQEIKVSDGEAAVILPAKTAANAAAVQGIRSIIQQSNDGIPPKGGIQDGGRYMTGAIEDGLPVRYVPDEIDLARGQMETEMARAADAAARAKAARAGAVVPVPAPEPYKPNWTQPRNLPAQYSPPPIEGVVETVADQRAARAALQPKSINAPTSLVPPVSTPNWTAGGNPQNVGPTGSGQWSNQGWNEAPGRAAMPQRGGGIQGAVQALPSPAPELMKATGDARTAAGAKAAGRASKEAAAYANRPAFETSPLANVRPNAALAGRVINRVVPAVGGALAAGNIADVATDPNKTGADVATQVAREAGGWGAATAGAALGAKAGAALGLLGGPVLAPITVPAGVVVGGIGGGLAANYGANKLMDIGGEAPSRTSNGVVTRFFSGGKPAPVVDPVRAKHNEILDSGRGTGIIDLPITPSAKRAAIASAEEARRAAASKDSGATVRNGIVSAEMGRGFDPTKLTMAPGYGMATNAIGKTLSVGPSEYVAADGSKTSRWEDTQAYQDAIARNAADKLRLAEMQSLRLGSDPMAVQASQQGIAGAVLANRAQEAALQRNQYIQALVAKAAAETDPVKQRAIIDTALAAQGKDSRHGKNLHVVDMGEYTEPDGMGGLKTIKRGQALYDADTRQVIPIQPGSPAAGATRSFATQEEAAAAQRAGKIKIGDVVTIGGKQFNVTPD